MVLVVVVVVVGGGGGCCCFCCCCCYPCNSVRRVYSNLSKKNIVNAYFFTPGKPRATVFPTSFPFGGKKCGIYNCFCAAPSKNTGIYTVLGTLQEMISHAKVRSLCRLQCFGVWLYSL